MMSTVLAENEESKSLALKEVEQRAKAAYVGLAIGDALGATVEFMTPREIAHRYGIHKTIIGEGWLNLKKGQVTDDTTMSLALGKAIIEEQGIYPLAIAKSFDEWMRGKPIDIGNTVRRGLINFRHTGDPVSHPNEFDAGNGACMRTLPIALATLGCDEKQIKEAIAAQAHITHNNALSDAGTYSVVSMIQDAMLGATPLDLLNGQIHQLIEAYPKYKFRGRRNSNPSGFIVDTLKVVFEAVVDTDNFTECLIQTVNRGGDADTTGAISGMIAGALYGWSSIPNKWLKAVDKGVVKQCKQQASDLVNMSPLFES